jgi:hypothetical protein
MMTLDESLRQHPAYESHRVVKSLDGFSLVQVRYRTDHPDYEGGTRLEAWDDEDEYVSDVSDADEFDTLVEDINEEREEQ